MVEAVGIVGTGSGVSALRAPVVAAGVSAGGEASASSPALGVQPISPSSRADPTTGILITEFLSSEGQVRMQIPSQVVVAYLRSGLTEAGQPKPDASVAVEKDGGGVVA